MNALTSFSNTTVVSLLEKWGFDARGELNHRIQILRHAPFPSASFYAWGIEYLEQYQSYQARSIFDGCDFVVSFLGTESTQAKFVGIYRKLGKEVRGTSTFPEPTGPPPLVAELVKYPVWYSFIRDTRFDQFRDKIHIDWVRAAHIWNQYLPDHDKPVVKIDAGIDLTIAIPSDLPPDIQAQIAEGNEASEFSEGAIFYEAHVSRERSAGLVRLAKERHQTATGRLACEVCGFDFHIVYGSVGQGYIECHHTIPVSELPPNAKTRVEDVALVCSNCHRMLHRCKPWLKTEELQKLLVSRAGSV